MLVLSMCVRVFTGRWKGQSFGPTCADEEPSSMLSLGLDMKYSGIGTKKRLRTRFLFVQTFEIRKQNKWIYILKLKRFVFHSLQFSIMENKTTSTSNYESNCFFFYVLFAMSENPHQHTKNL